VACELNWWPIVLGQALLDYLRARRVIQFKGPHSSWEEARRHVTGYDDDRILEKVRASTLQVQAGVAVAERDGVTLNQVEYCWPATAALMCSAASAGGVLSVLDFGGSLGSSYFQNRGLMSRLAEVRWGVVEQANFVECGRRDVHQPGLSFHERIEDCARAIGPRVALLSGVLQMLEDPEAALREIDAAGVNMIVVDRTPVSRLRHDVICTQHVREPIYDASYPAWIFSEGRIARMLGPRWELVADFVSNDYQGYRCGRLRFQLLGGIYCRRNG
jgi:putative methyltransferase (TIGR04325 family)